MEHSQPATALLLPVSGGEQAAGGSPGDPGGLAAGTLEVQYPGRCGCGPSASMAMSLNGINCIEMY